MFISHSQVFSDATLSSLPSQEWPVIKGKGDLTFSSLSLQFQKDAKDAQDLLRKVDTDLDQKYSPDFKDWYQVESLLHELEASI